jgi:hypothetical protein
MSATNDKQPAAAKPAVSKTPTHVAYQVRDTEEGKGFWTRIGAGWPHADGNGFNIQIDNLPLDGRIVLRVATEKKE